MPVTTRILTAAISDTGTQRDNNEDRVLHDPERGLFAVIDGMGGHAAGEKAAAIANDVLRDRLSRSTGTVEERIREAIALANNEICRLAAANAEWRGMACVLTTAVAGDEGFTVGHVGDSRLYQLIPGKIRKLTRDHSPVGEREDAGELTETDAMKHPRRSEVYRDVGSAQRAPDDADFIEIGQAPLPANSAFVLCTDGLSDQVPSTAIREICEKYAGSPHITARELVNAANHAGGKDNVSVIVIEGSGYAAAVRERLVRRPPPPPKSFDINRILLPVLGAIIAWIVWTYFRPVPEPAPAPAPSPSQPAANITVRPGGSIAAAIAGAAAGATIIVQPGTYRENIRLRDGIELSSALLHKAIIEAPGIVVDASGVNNARIAGFRLTGPASQAATVGLLVDGNVRATQLDIRGVTRAAMEIAGDSRASLTNSTITGNPGAGVLIRDRARPELYDNDLSRNGRKRGELRPAIEVRDSAQPQLRGNTIQGSGAEEIWAHPLFDTSSVLRDNKVGRPSQDNTRKIRVLTE